MVIVTAVTKLPCLELQTARQTNPDKRVTCLNSTFIMPVIKYLVCIYISYIPNNIYIHTNRVQFYYFILNILQSSIYDESSLSEGFMSGRDLCLEGVIYGGSFV